MIASPEVEVFEDIETLSRAAAGRIARISAESRASHKRFTIALSGGSTPTNLYLLLGSGDYRRAIGWQHVHVFWVDERCVPPEHDQSNFKLAFECFLSKVALPSENVHRIKGEEPPDFAAGEYEMDLRRFFGDLGLPAFDLLLLGMGDDGHTASLFPGSPALAEQEHLAVAVYKLPPELNRVTLTVPVLNNARNTIFLVSGNAKAPIVRDVLSGEKIPRTYPAGLIRPADGRLTWLLDKAAAHLINKESSPVT